MLIEVGHGEQSRHLVDGERLHGLPQRLFAEALGGMDQFPNDGVIIVMVHPEVLLGLVQRDDQNAHLQNGQRIPADTPPGPQQITSW
jgi:hypothetical protein